MQGVFRSRLAGFDCGLHLARERDARMVGRLRVLGEGMGEGGVSVFGVEWMPGSRWVTRVFGRVGLHI